MSAHLNKAIHQSRKPASEVTETSEDSGLFATGICQLVVELIPQMRRTERDDVMIRGFADRRFEIDVIFAGRRAVEAGPLEEQLKALLRAARSIAKASRNNPPKIETLRLPVRVEGAWRRTAKRDETGWETCTYQFVAARWSLLDQNGNPMSFGKAAAVRTAEKTR